MSEDEEQLEPLVLHKKAWGMRELLENIVDRYFNRISDDFGDLPAWQVTPRKGTVSECVKDLDVHVRKLGWYPLVEIGEPYTLTLLDIPQEGHPYNSKFIQILIWAFSLCFCVSLGASWVSYQNSEVEWFHTDSLKTSLYFFATPLFSALLITSFIRKWLFDSYGVDGGHFLPAISPIIIPSKGLILWPFGLIGFFNQRLMPALVWPNRKSMLYSGIITPLSFLFFGICFSIVGIIMTPNHAPSFSDVPGIIQLNPITQIISSFLLTSEEINVRSIWLHPLALAGQTLMTFCWLLLIPVPGFPGYRALWAILGSDKMIDSGTEFALYGFFLIGIITILISSGYTPWLIIFGLGVWRMFSDQTRTGAGLITDDSTELDNGFGVRAFFSLFIVLFLTFPGFYSVSAYENWEDGLALDWPEDVTVSVDESWMISLDLELVGINPREISVDVWANPPRPDWNIVIGCGDDNQSIPSNCDVGDIDLLNKGEISISTQIANNSTGLLPTNIYLNVIDGSTSIVKIITFNPDSMMVPSTPYWKLEPTFDGLLACSNLTMNDEIPGNFSSQSLLWSVTKPINGMFTSDSDGEVCLSGPNYGKQMLERDRFGYIMPLYFINDLGQEKIWPLRIQNPIASLPIPDDGWLLSGKNDQTPSWLHGGEHVSWGDGLQVCTDLSPRIPVLLEGEMNWDIDVQTDIRIPDVSEESQMVFNPPIGGILATCDNSSTPQLLANYTTVSGPSLSLKFDNNSIWAWVDRPLESGVWEFINLGNESITIVPMFHHELDDNISGWVDSDGFNVPVGGTSVVDLTQTFDSHEIYQVAWLSLDEESGVSDSIRLNFGSWCFQGADLDNSDDNIECFSEVN